MAPGQRTLQACLLVTVLAITACFSARNIQAGPLRIGVASLTHGHAHDAFQQLGKGNIEIVGIAEANQELVDYYSRRYGIDRNIFCSELEEMLDKASPEAVAAYGSIYEHLAVVEACAPRGIHVMVEKPLAYATDHAVRMSRLAAEHDIRIVTNYATTWFPSVRAVYEIVHEKKLVGDLRKVVIHDGHEGPREIGCSENFLAWLTDPVQNGGGAIVDFGCYGANLMTWLMQGEQPLTVTAVTQQIKPDVYPHVDDEATIILTYPKCQAIIQASWNWPFDRKDMHVYGQTGYVFATDSHTLRMKTRGSVSEEEFTAGPQAHPADNPFSYLAAVVRGQIGMDEPGPSSLKQSHGRQNTGCGEEIGKIRQDSYSNEQLNGISVSRRPARAAPLTERMNPVLSASILHTDYNQM